MDFHPLSELFPLMYGREFDELVADITVNGLREPIVIFDGQILDGRNRWRACEQVNEERDRVGLPPVSVPTEDYIGDDALGFVLSLNLRRRHLNAGQLAALSLEIEELQAAKAKERRAATQFGAVPANLPEPEECGEASEKAAAVVGCSPRQVRKAKKLKRERPDLLAKVESGEVSLHAAERQADEDQRPQTEQREIIGPGQKGIRQAPKEIRSRRAQRRRHRVRAPGPRTQEKARIYRCNVALKQIVDAAKYISSDADAERLAAFLRDEAAAVSVAGCDAKEVAEHLRQFCMQLGKVIPAETPANGAGATR
jgi:hypothetical protein